jgi:putative ABC transport system permease protein
MDSLLSVVLTVRQYVLVAVALIGAAALATTTMVFLLSMRLRRAEINTMVRMGADPGRVAAILGAEILLVLTASLALAGGMTVVATAWGEELIRWMLFSGNS